MVSYNINANVRSAIEALVSGELYTAEIKCRKLAYSSPVVPQDSDVGPSVLARAAADNPEYLRNKAIFHLMSGKFDVALNYVIALRRVSCYAGGP